MEKDNKKTKEYFAKKTERIATAIHMVTSFLPDSEPIKQKLRENSIELIAHVYGGVREETAHMDVLNSIVGETVSLLEVGKVSGLISAMNVEILRKECVGMCEDYKGQNNHASFALDTLLPQTFFGHSAPERKAEPEVRKSPFSLSSRVFEEKRAPIVQKQPISSDKNTLRKEQILGIIREKGEVNIKDVARVITDCSEKTLQRDLLALVSDGMVKKRGERRWSTYSLR